MPDHLNIALLQVAVKNSHDIITVLQEDGTLLYVSPAITPILGFTPEQVIGTNGFDLVHPDDRAKLQAEFARAVQQGHGEVGDFRCRGTDERWRWLKSSGSVLIDANSTRTIIFNTYDVTAQHEALESLEKRNREMLTIWESITDGFYAFDTEWRFTYINTQGERILQRRREELLGKNIWQEFPGAVDTVLFQQYHRAMATGESVQFEMFYPPLSLWVNVCAYPSPAGLAVYFHDITGRKHAEATQKWLATIVESSDDAVISRDMDGNITSWNRGAERLYGYTREEATGQPMTLLSPPHRPHEIPGLLEKLRQGESIGNLETQRRRKDGTLLDVSLNLFPLFDAAGQMMGSAVIARDISERKRAEEALRYSENLYQTLAQNFPNGAVYLLDEQTRILVAGGRGLTVLGLSTESMLGKKPREVFYDDPELYHQLEAAHARALKGEETILELPIRGRLRYVQMVPVPDEQGKISTVLVMSQDITERKQAEAEQEQFFMLSLDMLCIFDDQGIFRRVSPAFEKVIGYAPAELIGKSFLDYLHPDDRAASEKGIEALSTGQPILNFVNRYHCRDGSYKTIMWATAPYENLYYAAGRDVTAIKAAEDKLEQSLALLSATLESTADGILVVNSDGQITHFNQQFLKMWRIPNEVIESGDNTRAIEFVKEQLIDADDFERSAHILSSELGREGFDLLHFKDGRIFERYSKTQRLNDREVGRVWSFRDITERLRAQHEQAELNLKLEEQRRRLDDILDNVPGIVWENVIVPGSSEQQAAYVSRYVETMLGYTPDEWIHSPGLWVQALYPDDRERVFEQSAAILQSGRPGVLQYRFITKGGDVVWTETQCVAIHNAQNQVIGLRGVTMNITERMEAQAEQSRLAALLESTTDLVGWSDTQGRARYINPAGRAMLGLSQDEPTEARSIMDFSPAWANELLQKIALPTASQTGSWSGESALLTRDGREIPVSQVITAHKDAEGNDLFFSTIAHDISESKNVQAILQRSNEELEELVRARTAELAATNLALQTEVTEKAMAVQNLHNVVELLEQARQDAETAKEEAQSANLAKSEFLSRMSHELRTPLNAILGFGQVLESDELSEGQRESVDYILRGGHHLLKLINEVLNITRIETGHLALSLEPVSVWDVMSDSLDLVMPSANKNAIQIHNAITQDDDVHVRADQQRLKQVLINLLSNAVKYNRAGGQVDIFCRQTGPSLLRIGIQDTGHGIAAQDIARLFVAFERLDADKTQIEGTGLGLALSKGLIEAMQGHIGVESAVGRGSTFFIELPIVSSPLQQLNAEQKEEKETAQNIAASTRKVLLIEDNLSNLRLIQTIIQKRPNIKLLEAMQGSIGLEMARQHQPDLILLDMHLPDIMGDEVLRGLQKFPETKNIPVVICSADATRSQIDNLLAQGATAYLTKPLNMKQFLQMLDQTLKNES